MSGSLEVIMGSMFSGKTEELVRRVRRAVFAKQKVTVFKPDMDNRYSETDITSHCGSSYACIPVADHPEIIRHVTERKPDLVGIDEAQFFSPNLVYTLTRLVDDMGKRVVVAGLDTDFMGQPFPTMIPVVFEADDLTKLRAVCVQCGAEASRNQRIMDGMEQVHGDLFMVGGEESYEARCRSCFVRPLSRQSDKLEIEA